MPLIAFLAPDEDMLATARTTLAKTHPDVLLEQGLLSAGVRKARRLVREGVEIVITVQAGRQHNRPCVMIRSGAEGIIQATLEAKRIAEARRIEKVKSTLFQTVLDYAYEGIISVDQDRQVVTFNPEAERITRIDGKRAIGRRIQDILPQLKLERLLTTGKDELGQVIDVGRVQILCNKGAYPGARNNDRRRSDLSGYRQDSAVGGQYPQEDLCGGAYRRLHI